MLAWGGCGLVMGTELWGGGVESGNRVTFSICARVAITSAGTVMRPPVILSRITERYVGRDGGGILLPIREA